MSPSQARPPNAPQEYVIEATPCISPHKRKGCQRLKGLKGAGEQHPRDAGRQKGIVAGP